MERIEAVRKAVLAVLVLALCFVLPLTARTPRPPAQEDVDKTGSPYFFVQGDSTVESFPLLSTDADVVVSGMSADVRLTQVYKNDGKKAIEAVYVFPLGTKAAIHAMRMRVGDRIIDAEINRKDEARKIYDDAKQDGRTASLLEQERPNVFQMSVANIMPGDRVEVIVDYVETIVPESGIYEFVFPTVVGPRFTGESSKQENWTASPYLREGKEAPYDFSIKAEISTGIPAAKVWSDSHRIETDFSDRDSVKVKLAGSEYRPGNKDFILRYTLRGNAIQTGAILYPGENENFFLAMIEPPARVEMKDVNKREYLFLVDVSGSMHGFPLDVSKHIMTKIIRDLKSTEYFNILFFAGSNRELFPKAMPATDANKDRAMKMLNAQQGGGGTQILNAFRRAVELPKKEGMSRIAVALTDGYIAVEKEVFDVIRDKMGDTNFFAFGIGTSVNRYLIEGMARAGKGEPFVAVSKAEGEKQAEKFLEYVKKPVLTDIKVRFDGFDAYDVEPEQPCDLFAEKPVVITGKYMGKGGRLIITGKRARGEYEKIINLAERVESSQNKAVKFIWARERIARLDDYSKVGVDTKEEVTKLGLKYNLMTAYTSFVAADKVIRNNGEIVTVKQPLPLPEGVSDYAVGANAAQTYSVKSGGGLHKLYAPARSYDKLAEAAPAMPAEEKDEAVKSQPAVSGSLYLTDGEVPSGYSINDAEKAVFGNVKAELERFMAKNRVKNLKLKIKVSGGSVKSVDMEPALSKKAYKDIFDILKKVAFGRVSGEIVLVLELM